MERQPIELVGIARGPAAANFPYEFSTDNGVAVRLHDMAFLGLEYRTADATLTLRFRYDAPRWTPAQAVATPVALFVFGGVRMESWLDDGDPLDAPPEARGQVGDFEFEPSTSQCSLSGVSTALRFSARRLEVTLQAI